MSERRVHYAAGEERSDHGTHLIERRFTSYSGFDIQPIAVHPIGSADKLMGAQVVAVQDLPSSIFRWTFHVLDHDDLHRPFRLAERETMLRFKQWLECRQWVRVQIPE
jgi:hypothetical protein